MTSVRKLPGTAANDASIGTIAWVDASNALVSDDSRATVAFTAGSQTSQYLKLTNFGFNIPPDNRIDGIVVEQERRNNAAGTVTDALLVPVKAGTIQATNTGKFRAEAWQVTTDEIAGYGSPRDTWRLPWTPADINNSGFGIAIRCRKADAGATSAEVDAVWITVYYSRAGDQQQITAELRTGKPPHTSLIQLGSDVRYGLRLRGMNTASLTVPRSHALYTSGALYDALYSDPDNPCMITARHPDGLLPFVGFVTKIADSKKDGMLDIQAKDHTVRLARGLCPQSGGGQASSGQLLRTAFQHIRSTYIDPYFELSDIKDGPPASYDFKLDKGDRFPREMEDQTGWDFYFSHLFSNGVRTLAQWTGPAGTDRRSEDAWQDGVHFTSREYDVDFEAAVSGVVAIGGNGPFADRTGAFVSSTGRSVGNASGAVRQGVPHRGFGGVHGVILPQATDQSVLRAVAQQKLERSEHTSEQIGFTLLEKAVDRSRLGLGDLRQVRFETMGKDIVREVRIIGLDLSGDGVVGVECEVLG